MTLGQLINSLCLSVLNCKTGIIKIPFLKVDYKNKYKTYKALSIGPVYQIIIIIQFSSVTQSCPTLCDPMDCSSLGLPVHHQLMEFTQTHVHRVSDAIQPSHLPYPSPAPNPSQHQGLFQRVSSSYQVTKVLKFQLQHQSFQ